MKSVLATVGGMIVLSGVMSLPSMGMGSERAGASDGSPHVLFVNVGKAIDAKHLEAASSNACAQMQVRWRTVSVPEIKPDEMIVSKEKQSMRWGKGAVLVVYLANSPELPGLLNLPGQCSLINIRTMRVDQPSEEVYAVRLRRLLMKGLAYAAGVGGNHDPRCVMYWKSFSAGGIDGTTSTFGPYAYFALQDILGAVGGEAIFSVEH